MLGILDWGIGGIGFYSRLKRERPAADLIYLSDAGSPPYGRLDRLSLLNHVTRAVEYLQENGAVRVVVACNAASTVLSSLPGSLQSHVVGIIDSGIAMVRDAETREISIVGGERTIRSHIYHRRLAAEGINVRGRIAQPLSGMIERGEHRDDRFRKELERILHPLRGCESLLLACTHYPAAAEIFAEMLPTTRLLDPVDHLLARALDSWELTSSDREDQIYTTGNPEDMRSGAAAAFHITLPKIEQIALSSFR